MLTLTTREKIKITIKKTLKSFIFYVKLNNNYLIF